MYQTFSFYMGTTVHYLGEWPTSLKKWKAGVQNGKKSEMESEFESLATKHQKKNSQNLQENIRKTFKQKKEVKWFENKKTNISQKGPEI